ncbi:MAG: hypothetical protein M3O50_02165 [Myxococcota bacterium]|nr:hypothetical protein [Myxococcota bacterium]
MPPVEESRGSAVRLRGLERVVAGFAAAVVVTCTPCAPAQEQPRGFAVERLYRAAPGAGWLVMDDLDMRGGLGGALSLAGGYAHAPLRVADGGHRLTLVRDQAFVDFGLAVTFDRFRGYANMTSPVVNKGESGTVPSLTAPAVDLGSNPDTVSEVRVGVDARLFGGPKSALRVGAGAQLIVSSATRADYLTDGTPRGMVRLLWAGSMGMLTYAGQVGAHIRPLDEGAVPESPKGSELLFGVAAGPRLLLGARRRTALVIGPELFGETAFRAFLNRGATGVEALVSARAEGTDDDGPQLRVQVGAGAGLNAHFGAPEWRMIIGVEVFDRSSDSDGDGIFDSNDACPREPGLKTRDPKTNGCPAERDTESRPEPHAALPVPFHSRCA